jgi:hypothetical protein
MDIVVRNQTGTRWCPFYLLFGHCQIGKGGVRYECRSRLRHRARHHLQSVPHDGRVFAVARGRVERSVPAGFTASETFDIGVDLGSPVSLDYHAGAPFAFTGTIAKISFQFIQAIANKRGT